MRPNLTAAQVKRAEWAAYTSTCNGAGVSGLAMHACSLAARDPGIAALRARARVWAPGFDHPFGPPFGLAFRRRRVEKRLILTTGVGPVEVVAAVRLGCSGQADAGLQPVAYLLLQRAFGPMRTLRDAPGDGLDDGARHPVATSTTVS
jgi:hypothetical protein